MILHFHLRVLTTLLAFAIAVAGSSARAEERLIDDFEGGSEGAKLSWSDTGQNAAYQLLGHRRVRDKARQGEWAEEIRVNGSGLEWIYFGHDLPPARVVDELSPAVWIKSDRAGVQMFVRVVLPHTRDPNSGRPAKVFIAGSKYRSAGSWERLRTTNIAPQIAREIRHLRWKSDIAVDPREAYIDQVVLNVFGGSGITSVLIDDLTMEGFVPRDAVQSVVTVAAEVPVETNWPGVSLNSTVLSVDGTPFFPRVIQHQGEPLEFLGKLGFNVIEIAEPASPDVLAEARRLGLWLICPPPQGPLPQINASYDPVLAWNLGRGLAMPELEPTVARAKALKLADGARGRPLLCNADTSMRAFSRHVNILLTARRPLASSLELADFGTWLRNCPRLVQPGTPLWSTVQTDPSERLRAQIAPISSDLSAKLALDDDAIRLMVHTSVAAGSRGLVFESSSRLDDVTPAARRRAAVLELVNLELQVLEPWVAAGRSLGMAASSDPNISGAVLQTNKARVVLPIRSAAGAQYVPVHTPGQINFLVPGVPRGDEFYELTPAGVQPLRSKSRVAGGEQITLEEFGLTSMIVTTSEPSVYGALYQRLARNSRRMIELQRELTVQALEEAEAVQSQVPAGAIPNGGAKVASARAALSRADVLSSKEDYRGSLAALTQAAAETRALRRGLWERAALSMGSPVASPTTSCFATLPQHWAMLEQLKTSQAYVNEMPGGDFEDLNALVASGWQHYGLVQPEAVGTVELSTASPHAGSSSLRLKVVATNEKAKPELLETPPLWVVSAPMQVRAGELVCIRGWVRISAPITGSVDGLMIVDSFGGEPLALRLGQTNGWKEFILYRVAPSAGSLSVTFAMTGLGEAMIDDFTVQRVQLGALPMQQARQALPPTRGPVLK